MVQVAWAQVEYVSQWVDRKRPPVQGVFPSMAEGKMPPAQVAASDLHHVCRWSTCTGFMEE